MNNDFAYLAHDDGWYCKLYCKNLSDFVTVLCKKVVAGTHTKNICEQSTGLKDDIFKLAVKGLLIDLNEFYWEKDTLIKLQVIGSSSDMDIIQNNYQRLKNNATQIYNLRFNQTEWNIS